jgi:hypothetical protein
MTRKVDDGSYPLSADRTLINDLLRPWLIFFCSVSPVFFFLLSPQLNPPLSLGFLQVQFPCQDSSRRIR